MGVFGSVPSKGLQVGKTTNLLGTPSLLAKQCMRSWKIRKAPYGLRHRPLLAGRSARFRVAGFLLATKGGRPGPRGESPPFPQKPKTPPRPPPPPLLPPQNGRKTPRATPT